MFADVLPKTYYGKWILLDKPNKDEKCKEIFIESRIYKYVILSEVKYLRFQNHKTHSVLNFVLDYYGNSTFILEIEVIVRKAQSFGISV